MKKAGAVSFHPKKTNPGVQSHHAMLKPGLYRHFKGNIYKVIGTATHLETLEEMVVYSPQYGEKKILVFENFGNGWKTIFAFG